MAHLHLLRLVILNTTMLALELWLGSPSESIGEGIGKVGANIGYSIVNSPYSLFTGQTIGGSPLNSTEKIEAFIDFVPGLISVGLTKTEAVVKTTEKAFQANKVNQQGLKDLGKGLKTTGVISTTKKELEKK